MVLPLGDLEKTQIVPWATYVLIALNVVAFAAQKLDATGEVTLAYAATPYEITHNEDLTDPVLLPAPVGFDPFEVNRGPRSIPHVPGPHPIWLTLFTAMFLHGSPL